MSAVPKPIRDGTTTVPYKPDGGGSIIVSDLGDVLLSADSRGNTLPREEFYNPPQSGRRRSPAERCKDIEKVKGIRKSYRQRQRQKRQLPRDEFLAKKAALANQAQAAQQRRADKLKRRRIKEAEAIRTVKAKEKILREHSLNVSSYAQFVANFRVTRAESVYVRNFYSRRSALKTRWQAVVRRQRGRLLFVTKFSQNKNDVLFLTDYKGRRAGRGWKKPMPAIKCNVNYAGTVRRVVSVDEFKTSCMCSNGCGMRVILDRSRQATCPYCYGLWQQIGDPAFAPFGIKNRDVHAAIGTEDGIVTPLLAGRPRNFEYLRYYPAVCRLREYFDTPLPLQDDPANPWKRVLHRLPFMSAFTIALLPTLLSYVVHDVVAPVVALLALGQALSGPPIADADCL